GSRSYKEFRSGLAADPELEFLTGVHPEDRDQIRQIFRETLATGLAQRHEHRFVSPNGSEHLLESHTSAIRDNDGKVTHVLSVSRDITERQRAAAHIQQQSALLDNLRDAIYLCSLDGRILFWNKRCEDIYGWRSHEAVGQDPERLLGDKKSFEAAAPNVALTGKDAIVECERSTKDGRKITVQSQRTVLRDGQECATAILCVDFDLSEWKAYTRRSLQTQQFDFTGALLQAAAQDLSRVLSPFLLACGQAARGNWNESVNRALDTTRLHMDRASEIVQQLGLFAEAMHPRFAAIEIAPILEEMVAMLRGAMPHSIQIETSIAPDLPPIWGDASHLHQILIELCRNAREAMPGGGRLRIRADHKTFEARPHWMLDQPAAGDYVAITITDEGVGLPRPLAEKIFQPYFSLKKQDPNSGLGLSIVFALVKSHRGFIDVDADLSQGSSFQVFLPAHSTVAKLGLHAPPAAAPMGRGETLLLVDDHRLLREAARQLLEMFSYSVCTASNASAALELYRAKQTQIAAVIVDLVMPFDEGPGLMRALRAINPGVKMIAITGQGPWASQIDPTLQPRAYLTKPYRIEKLLLLLRTQLEG
ncbi:MAG: PAS domain S-box protein, partial [Verrucomicrobiota bacterium]